MFPGVLCIQTGLATLTYVSTLGYPTLACLPAAFADTAHEIAVLVFPLWSHSQCQVTYKHLKYILRPGMGGLLNVHV